MRAKNISFRHLILALASDMRFCFFHVLSNQFQLKLPHMSHYRPRASNPGPFLCKVAKFGFQLLQLVRLRFPLARHSWANCFLHVTRTFCSIQNPAHVFLSRSIICGVTPIHAISFDFSLLENAADFVRVPARHSFALYPATPGFMSSSHKRHQNFSHPIPSEFFQRFTPRFLPTSHYFGLFISVVPRPASSSSVNSAQYLFYPFHPTIFDIS